MYAYIKDYSKSLGGKKSRVEGSNIIVDHERVLTFIFKTLFLQPEFENTT